VRRESGERKRGEKARRESEERKRGEKARRESEERKRGEKARKKRKRPALTSGGRLLTPEVAGMSCFCP
jgi:hypothetical protein